MRFGGEPAEVAADPKRHRALEARGRLVERAAEAPGEVVERADEGRPLARWRRRLLGPVDREARGVEIGQQIVAEAEQPGGARLARGQRVPELAGEPVGTADQERLGGEEDHGARLAEARAVA